MDIDARIEALTQSLELLTSLHRDQDARIAQILVALDRDAENIRGLARIAEIHERASPTWKAASSKPKGYSQTST